METLGQCYVQSLFSQPALDYSKQSMGICPGKLYSIFGFFRWVENSCTGENRVPHVAKNLGGKKVASTGGIDCHSSCF